MLSVIKVFGYPVAMYGLSILVGIMAGICVSVGIGKKRKLSVEDDVFAFLYGGIGVAVGGKLLYVILGFPQIYKVFKEAGTIEAVLPYLTGGFVFYGGILGGFAMVGIYCKKFKCSAPDIFAAIIPAVPLVHAVGRVGCFCAGCCYGIPYDGFGSIMFSHAIAGPNGIALFPVQLVEMIINLLICLELTIFSLSNMPALKLLGIYLIEYGTARFFLEFLRGDYIRGFWLGLSTSQWISILVFIGGCACIIKETIYQKNQITGM